jgi:hypothetical protein
MYCSKLSAPPIFVMAQRWNSDISKPANTQPAKPLTEAPANTGPTATPLEQPSYQLTSSRLHVGSARHGARTE